METKTSGTTSTARPSTRRGASTMKYQPTSNSDSESGCDNFSSYAPTTLVIPRTHHGDIKIYSPYRVDIHKEGKSENENESQADSSAWTWGKCARSVASTLGSAAWGATKFGVTVGLTSVAATAASQLMGSGVHGLDLMLEHGPEKGRSVWENEVTRRFQGLVSHAPEEFGSDGGVQSAIAGGLNLVMKAYAPE